MKDWWYRNITVFVSTQVAYYTQIFFGFRVAIRLGFYAGCLVDPLRAVRHLTIYFKGKKFRKEIEKTRKELHFTESYEAGPNTIEN